MSMIWDFSRITKTLKELNFDTEKNPLGRLTFDQIQKGYFFDIVVLDMRRHVFSNNYLIFLFDSSKKV